MVYAVEELVAVAAADVALYELLQFQGVGFEEDRGFFGVLAVERVVYYIVRLVVVQVGAGVEVYLLFLHGGVVVFEQAFVGPGLVGRVGGFLRAAGENCAYYGVFGGEGRLLPLL